MGRISKVVFQSQLSSRPIGRCYEVMVKSQHMLDMPASHGNTPSDARRSVGGLCTQRFRSTSGFLASQKQKKKKERMAYMEDYRPV